MANTTKPNSAFLAGKKIIIAGAGISGLSFAIALHKFWLSQDPSIPPFTITFYERDSAILGPDREGYSLSIRSDGQSGGMKTLKNLGLVDLLLSKSITGIQGGASGNFCLWDREWEEIIRMGPKTLPPGTPHPHMRIARNVLRQTLVEAVPKQSKIHWGTACMGAVEMSNGRVGVQLSNGKVDECDLLIAADGSKSKIRMSLRPEDKLNYAGAVCIGGNAKFSGEIPEPANKDWGAHLTGTGTGLFVSPIDEHSAVWNISYLSPTPRALLKQPWTEEQRNEVLKEALERGKEIVEPFATYVKATDMATLLMLNTMDKPAFSHKELKNTRIVFIGDANRK
jgi:2-polyprenyl-6-methoxyphenol hydroxylase-like FAD-dependent oxidoreductase